MFYAIFDFTRVVDVMLLGYLRGFPLGRLVATSHELRPSDVDLSLLYKTLNGFDFSLEDCVIDLGNLGTIRKQQDDALNLQVRV